MLLPNNECRAVVVLRGRKVCTAYKADADDAASAQSGRRHLNAGVSPGRPRNTHFPQLSTHSLLYKSDPLSPSALSPPTQAGDHAYYPPIAQHPAFLVRLATAIGLHALLRFVLLPARHSSASLSRILCAPTRYRLPPSSSLRFRKTTAFGLVCSRIR